ncbi:glutamate receptor ionotropic, delta-1-like isoform X1 [Haemaphysalis longicornis]
MGIRLSNGSWTGAVGNVQRREVDMTIVPMIQSHSRMTVGEYGPPIMYVQFGILSGSGVSTSNVFGYILTFDWKVWALLLSAIPVLALLISLSEFVIRKTSWKEIWPRVHEWGWEIFRNLLYESSPWIPSQTSARVVLTAWLLAVLVIANSFAGHLKSSMAIKYQPRQVENVRDVVASRGIRPIVWKGSHYEAFLSTARSPVLSALWRMVSRTNGSQLGRDMFRDEHMRQVVARRAVLMVDHISLQWRMAAYCSRTLVPSFHLAREPIEENPLSFLMSRHMPRALHQRIYARITWMYENGLVNKWMADSLGDWQRCVRQTGGHAADDLTVEDTLASFVLWALVMALAAAAFLAEVLLHAHSRKKSPPYPRPSRPAMVRRGVMLTRVGLNRRRVPRTIRHGHLQSV